MVVQLVQSALCFKDVSKQTQPLPGPRMVGITASFHSIIIFWISVVSFAAITLYVSQWVFTVVHVVLTRSSPMSNLKEQHMYIKCCFRLRKTALEMHKMLKTAFSDKSLGRHKLLSSFLPQTWRNFGWRLTVFRSSLYRLQRWKHGGHSQNHQWSLTKYLSQIDVSGKTCQ